MEIYDASPIFASLGHPGRLAVFRLLMRHAPKPVRPTEIADSLSMKANTLSHHLADLESAGLIAATREGRSLYYSVRLDRAAALVSYLFADCGRSRPDLIPSAANSTMPRAPYNVLFICSGNSARSIFAEAILTDLGGWRFKAFSAGTRPGSQLNPYAVTILERAGHDVTHLRSKHISEFESPDAPKMDFVFTVCDAAASEECAPWSGVPLTAHWGLPDPVKASGSDAEKALAFANTYAALHKRLTAFTALSIDQIDRLALQHRLDAIGQN